MKKFEFNWACTEYWEVTIEAETAMEALAKWKKMHDEGFLYDQGSSYDVSTCYPHRVIMKMPEGQGRLDHVELEGTWQGGMTHNELSEDDIEHWWKNDVRKEAKEKANVE